MTNNEEILYRLKSSPFRAKFNLDDKDRAYIKDKGLDTIRLHAYDFIEKLCRYVEREFPGLNVRVHRIVNDFFGHSVTVSGLITGGDLVAQLEGKMLSRELLITENMLRSGETVFLDDVTMEQAAERLNINITPVPDSSEPPSQ